MGIKNSSLGLRSRDFLHKIGFCLVFCGVPLGMYLNQFFPIVRWSPFIMFASVVLLFDFRRIWSRMRWNKSFLWLLFLQLLMLFYWFFTSKHEIKYLNFHLYLLALIVVFVKNRELSRCDYMTYLFLFSNILTLIGAVIYYTGFYSFQISYSEESIIDPFTASIPAYVNLCVSLFLFDRRSIWKSVFIVLAIALDFYVFLSYGKRSFFVSAFLILFIFIYKCRFLLKGTILFAVFFSLVCVTVSPVRKSVFGMVERTVVGVTDVYGTKKVTYDENSSSATRQYNNIKTRKQIEEDFTLVEYIVGGGYMYKYLDNPIWQSYVDMGVLGFLAYLYVVIINPLKKLWKVSCINRYLLMTLLFSVINIVTCLFNFTPYDYTIHTPLCLIALYAGARVCHDNRK